LPEISAAKPPAHDIRAAVIAAALIAERDRTMVRALATASSAPAAVNAWTMAARRDGLRSS
jgi:hypothetical protein